MSYAFKYGLLKTLLIKTADDADNEHTEGKHVSKEAEAALRRVKMQIDSIETEEDLKEFRNNEKAKDDFRLLKKHNPTVASELHEKVKNIDVPN